MWHQAHLAAWGRIELMERSNEFYFSVLNQAEAYAEMQGYDGARWFKMRAAETNVVWTGPSSVGPLLLQEQPHPIVYAELSYRWATSDAARAAVLHKWGRLVDRTAAFMASFALRAKSFPTRGCLNLGPPMAPGMGVEGGDPGNEMNWTNTLNSVYENTYWRWGLELAQRWRERTGKARDSNWTLVTDTLCHPRVRDWNGTAGVYFFDDSTTTLLGDSSTLGQIYACGHIPCLQYGINASVMRATITASLAEVKRTGGGAGFSSDFFDYAMAAVRLGQQSLAIDLLVDQIPGATYNPQNGLWSAGAILPLYTPSNGCLLLAVAMMAGGWDGDGNRTAPGFPDQGWAVQAEGFGKLF
jgi:hypothetical protein